MCAILGLFSKSSPLEKLQKSADKKLNMMKSRGPDYSATKVISTEKYKGVIGHNRLAIIDLDSGSNQPIYDSSKRYILVFNGEIYNYRELASEIKNLGIRVNEQSDTDVLVNGWHLWGTKLLPKLRGMFAFAVYDLAECTVTLARDIFGIKPLYYRVSEDIFQFSSTIKPCENLVVNFLSTK